MQIIPKAAKCKEKKHYHSSIGISIYKEYNIENLIKTLSKYGLQPEKIIHTQDKNKPNCFFVRLFYASKESAEKTKMNVNYYYCRLKMDVYRYLS